MQTDGDLICICETSPYAGQKRGGMLSCQKFQSYSQVLTELGLWERRNEWREWVFDGARYFVALDGGDNLVVFQLVKEEAKT
jgi:hypothetical protein